MLAGREFTRADVLGSPKVAIVNEEFAGKFNLGRDAVGRRMAISGNDELDLEIVGRVQNSGPARSLARGRTGGAR